MSHAATLRAHQPASGTRTPGVVWILLILWFGLIFGLGARGAFVRVGGAPPLSLLAAVMGPVVTFLIAYRVFPAVRESALMADVRFITAIQAWRFGGFAFLALNTYGVLPAHFAWPAGLGDMAIGATAVWMLTALARDPGFAASRTFVIWNVLGILDLVVAISSGAVVPLLFSNVGSTDAMAHLPLVLIPGFFVPGFVILHVIALMQARRAASE